ncbi:MAG TPA: adenylate/guanylate cyclase domain-containing protein [Usitatibacter sp.]|nr:adenylate/guanylate cyclase domain-containing protein [Usitatibacter sp.]
MSEASTPPREPQDLERRLATILCADVAGYSRMMGENEERTVRVFRGHREIFESMVAEHRGRIFNTAGDALLAEFTSAVEAVRAATDIQAALRTRNEHLAPEERMQFRIGVNLGDVIVQGGDLLGDGVNVAARIQQGTEPGGVCISGSVYEQIQNKLSLDFKLLGELSYKNIAKPIRTYTINEGAAVTSSRKGPSKTAIAVAAGAVLAAGAAYWGYTQVEAQRAERARMEAQLAEQKSAAAEAQRSAEAATREAQRTAEEAKREAQVQAQTQAAQEALQRATAESARVEQERKQLEAEKKTAEAAQKAPAVAAAPASPASAAQFDGKYSGRLCNQFGARNCWPLELVVHDGIAEGGWMNSRAKKRASAHGAVAPDGVFRLKLSTHNQRGEPTEAMLVGRVAAGSITAAGKWTEGGIVTGEWRLGPAPSSPVAASSRGAAKHDGNYSGRICNEIRGRAPICWPVELAVRNGHATASWLSRTGNTSTAQGTVADDGKVELHLSAWDRRGEATEAKLAGRISGEGAIDAFGAWSESGVKVAGSWHRSP